MLEKEDILNFWFTECTPEQWFKKDSEFDKMLEARFAGIVERALAGKLDSWADSDSGCLALILLLDQFTRNIFRDTPRAFSGDEKSLELSFLCEENGYLAIANTSAVNDSPSAILFFHSVPHYSIIHFIVSFRMRNLLASETLIPHLLTNVQELNFGVESAQTVPPYLDVLLHNHRHSVH